MALCEHCHKHNGDHFDDESERYDYYSCDVMNMVDLEKYGHYDSKENEVDKTKCKYYGCETCAISVEPKKEEFYIGNVKVIRDDHKCGMIWCPRENTKKETLDKWDDLKKWLEKKKADSELCYYLDRWATYDDVLNKMIGLEGRDEND